MRAMCHKTLKNVELNRNNDMTVKKLCGVQKMQFRGNTIKQSYQPFSGHKNAQLKNVTPSIVTAMDQSASNF